MLRQEWVTCPHRLPQAIRQDRMGEENQVLVQLFLRRALPGRGRRRPRALNGRACGRQLAWTYRWSKIVLVWAGAHQPLSLALNDPFLKIRGGNVPATENCRHGHACEPVAIFQDRRDAERGRRLDDQS